MDRSNRDGFIDAHANDAFHTAILDKLKDLPRESKKSADRIVYVNELIAVPHKSRCCIRR